MKLGRILAGLASGAALGILFAPKKGKELRKQILKKKKTEDPAESLKALGMAFKEAGEEMLGEVKNLSKNKQVAAALKTSKAEMKKQMAKFEEKYPEFTQMAKEKIDAITSAATEKKADVKKAVKKAKAVKKKVSKKVKKVAKKAKSVQKKVVKKAKTTQKKAGKAVKKVKKATKKK